MDEKRRMMVRDVLAALWARVPVPLRRRVVWMTQPTFTVGVSGVILNEQDEILLLRHRFREKRGWELPGGLLQRLERPEDALRRELHEEVGYAIDVLDLVSTEASTPLHLDVCFVARTRSGPMTLNTAEILEARFFPYSELAGLFDADQQTGIDLALTRLTNR